MLLRLRIFICTIKVITVGYIYSEYTAYEENGYVELCAQVSVNSSGEGLRRFDLTVNTVQMTAGD